MADGGYYDGYPHLDGSSGMLPGIGAYRTPTNGENFDGSSSSAKGPGFYQEQYAGLHGNGSMGGGSVSSAGGHMGSIEPINVAPSGAQDYSLPGSHSSKDMVAASLAAMDSAAMAASSMGTLSSMEDPMYSMAAGLSHQNMLAKPVPMRRLSEKSIAQARASLTTATMEQTSHSYNNDHLSLGRGPNSAIARAISLTQQTQRRPRSEKKAMPDEMKDGKYFERRKRNNLAAKKSRDARKAREDEIAIRASFLEKENAILRAQVATLREEANSLRQLLLQKRSRP